MHQTQETSTKTVDRGRAASARKVGYRLPKKSKTTTTKGYALSALDVGACGCCTPGR